MPAAATSPSPNDPSGGEGLGPDGGSARGVLQGVRVVVVGPGARARLDSLEGALQRDAGLARDAALGGPALALVAFALGPEPDLAVASGPALAAGVPTAARVALLARAPGFDGVTEAQVGGAFAHAFSGVCDLLVVSGLEPFGRRVLELRGEEAPRLCVAAFAPDEELSARARGWAEPALCVGPGADARLAFANVASITPDPGVPPSFVGRGGLGLAFARAGLAAVLAPSGGAGAQAAGAAQRQALHGALGRSPRLRMRAMEGTLELGSARGEVDATQALEGTPRTKHGCRGCPTPCGWVLQSEGPSAKGPSAKGSSAKGPSAVGLRYSALREALAAFGDPVAFVARSNELGVDAGAAAEAVRGVTGEDGPERALERLVSGAMRAGGAPAAGPASPAAALARVHGADRAAAVALLRGARGPEPLRALSLFGLGSAGLGPEGLAELLAPLPWTAGADPDVDAASLARWHECFAAAVDLSGFCGFSAGALVADGVLGLDALARALAPARGWEGSSGADRKQGEARAEDTGAAMLRAGARHLARHRALRTEAPAGFIPDELAGAVARYDEIAELEPGSDAAESLGGAPRATPQGTTPAVPVTVVVNGLFGERLRAARSAPGSTDPFEVRAATAREAVRVLSRGLGPGADRWLFSESGEVLPAVLRAGRVLRLDEPVRAGDTLELLLVVPGG